MLGGWEGCFESEADVSESGHISVCQRKLFSGSVKAKGRDLRGAALQPGEGTRGAEFTE
jgi:hypothetical protein